ncbi:hypothetical protein [Chryseobacterium vrystaatense]|uniref:Terminase-like family protein n=1 Tax=Chryseobacterium vrystaatense TaxID=307480 RepID=A0ABR4UJE6_9FLAO|nr:hypothetical protein [Chryseobacterium vrystaatense]KFF24771.1 hypothetical protein IW16_17705 [Chryseobacterium vrystaatense]
MMKNQTVRIDSLSVYDDVEVRYSTWLKMITDLMEPQNLFLVLGRGTGKTTDYLSERLMNICYEMPHSYIALVGNTYTNLLKNVVPAIIEGWNRKGWIEGIHYVVDQPPPDHFKKPYKTPYEYKHTISTFTGNFFNYISMDTPSSGAGNSYQHLAGDETKYLEKNRIDRLFPALRGDATMFAKSPYYLGVTFTTDYPNIIMPGEYDWILDKEKEMKLQQIKYLLQISLELNKTLAGTIRAAKKRNKKLLATLQNKMKKLSVLKTRLRINSTFFYKASSFVNVNILRLDYFKTALAALGEIEFNTAVLSQAPMVEAGQRFYLAFDNRHIYEDGIIRENYYRYRTGDDAETFSTDLKYCIPDKPLEIGADFGNMISMVVAQLQGNTIRVLKNIFSLSQKTEKICERFLKFFAHHKKKVIDFYFDRSANAYQDVGRDWANEMKKFLEAWPDGTPTGWTVNLMSRNQGNIEQQLEFNFVKALMNENYRELPNLLIDKYQCRQLISSMNVAKQIVKKNAKGISRIYKDKSSEKLPKEKLPMYSTNLSDALKYLLCRRPWLRIYQNKKSTFSDTELT